MVAVTRLPALERDQPHGLKSSEARWQNNIVRLIAALDSAVIFRAQLQCIWNEPTADHWRSAHGRSAVKTVNDCKWLEEMQWSWFKTVKVEEEKNLLRTKAEKHPFRRPTCHRRPAETQNCWVVPECLCVGPCSSFSLPLLYTRAFIKFFFLFFFFFSLLRTSTRENRSPGERQPDQGGRLQISSPGLDVLARAFFFFHFALTGCVAQGFSCIWMRPPSLLAPFAV